MQKAPAHIKIVKRGFERYSGHLGPILFKDGVSADPVPFYLVNRIAASLEIVYLDEDNNETPAGAAVALMANLTTRASEQAELERQNEDDRTREERAEALSRETPPVETFYTQEELEKIADGGIKALREVAKPWGVKGRAIPELVREILQAQAAFIQDRDTRRAAVGLPTQSEVDAAQPEAETPAETSTEPPTKTPAEPTLLDLIDAASGQSIADAINAAGEATDEGEGVNAEKDAA